MFEEKREAVMAIEAAEMPLLTRAALEKGSACSASPRVYGLIRQRERS
jgi:hypothetical protein